MDRNTVFVLGAGFTKAFLPEAPLTTDNYDEDGRLSERFQGGGYAGRLLGLEKKRTAHERDPHGLKRENLTQSGWINLERLMSRLHAGMPYDYRDGHRSELEYLLFETKRAFFRRLSKAADRQDHIPGLVAFAKTCLLNRAHCITFNYDDAFDWALTTASKSNDGRAVFWDLDTGYGFRCHSYSELHGTLPLLTNNPDLLLLKLHGSVNWKLKLGHTSRINPEDVIHLQNWYRHGACALEWTASMPSLELADPMPFLVPPVLSKSEIMTEPLLNLIWTKAREALREAKRVIFVGYSLPATDIAARFLFSETIALGTPIDVINFPSKENYELEVARIEDAYRSLFWAKETRFHWEDARVWLAKEFGSSE